jgi:hypothetical protein
MGAEEGETGDEGGKAEFYLLFEGGIEYAVREWFKVVKGVKSLVNTQWERRRRN